MRVLIALAVFAAMMTFIYAVAVAGGDEPDSVPVTEESPFCQHTNLQTGEIDFPCRDDR